MQEKLAEAGNEHTCVIAVIEKDGKILRGRRHYTPDVWKDAVVWTIPGGRCEKGETLEQTLKRETKEETNITDLEICEYVGEAPGAKEGDRLLIFYATTRQEPEMMEPEKFSEWRWFAKEEYLKQNPEEGLNPPALKIIQAFLRKLK